MHPQIILIDWPLNIMSSFGPILYEFIYVTITVQLKRDKIDGPLSQGI